MCRVAHPTIFIVYTPNYMPPSRPLLIDTDLSFDDYVALLYLLQHLAVDVRALTVANGVVHVRQGVENAQRALTLAGKGEIPVAGGPETPLSGGRTFPKRWRAILDYVPRLFLPRGTSLPSNLTAPALICHQGLMSDIPLTFVALGPLTNLALALQAEPTLPQHLARIFISGGAVHVPGVIAEDVPGHPNRVAEWNFYLDPEAAEIVFQSGIPITMIPMDATHVTGPAPLLFPRSFVRRLKVGARTPASRLMARFIAIWQMATPQFLATPVWDAASAVLLTDPEVGTTWQELPLRVVTHPDEVAGHTRVEPDQPPCVRVCLGGDQAAFEAAFEKIVKTPTKKAG